MNQRYDFLVNIVRIPLNMHLCPMKINRFYGFLMVLLLTTPVVAQKTPEFQVFKGDTINRRDARGLKQGLWRKYYRTDTLCSETFFKNDKAVGSTRSWYESGKLKGSVIIAKDGHRASATTYYESGKRMAVGIYYDQLKDSVWRYFNENDTLKTVEQYKRGVPDGKWLVYYDNGKLAEEKIYVKGKREGPYRQYNEDGLLIFEMTYKNDLEEGELKLYHLNGKLREKGQYVKGVKEGSWFTYDQLGNLLEQEIYKGGELVKK